VIRYEREDDALWAVADVAVGTERTRFRIPLGPWDHAEPSPGGLLGMPVVVLADRRSSEVIALAAERSGRARSFEVSPEGSSLLTAAAEGWEVLIVRDGNGRTMNVIRALEGRPLPVLPGADGEAIRTFLDGCHVDVEVAVPVVDDRQRGELRASLAQLRLEDLHHLIEVDPRPGLDAAGIVPEEAGEAELWRAAAGILAGRLAAARRRWLTGDR
jgi:hypothetical protein